MKKISAIDLFCGAGGTSTGLLQACEANGLGLDLTAVNHWPVAISTHSAILGIPNSQTIQEKAI